MTPALNPNLDIDAARAAFQATGRVHMGEVLTSESAEALAAVLEGPLPWERTMLEGGRTLDAPAAELEALSSSARAMLDEAVLAQARGGFGYRFDTVRVSNLVRAGAPVDPALAALYAWLNGPAFLDLVAEVTGLPRGAYVDAQATRYRVGDFLTAHDDEAEGRGRIVAYVLNLTRDWRMDWGGLLLFPDPQGHVEAGFTPAFNALNLFAVPRKHAVTAVAPFASGQRLSMTGWVRDRAPAGAEGN